MTDCKNAPRPEPDFMTESRGGSLSTLKLSLIVIGIVMSVIAIEKKMNW